MRAVIASLDYGDLLVETLPAWRSLLGKRSELLVVTHPRDLETISVASANGVRTVQTEAWSKDGAELNLAAAFDEAFRGVEEGEVCIAIDADVVPVGRLPGEDQIRRDVIYGAKRFAWLPGNNAGDLMPPSNLGYIRRRGREDSPEACAGYFQMFRFSGRRRFGSYPTAATYDYEFAFRFRKGETLSGFYVLHLGERQKNWSGRVTPRWEPARATA